MFQKVSLMLLSLTILASCGISLKEQTNPNNPEEPEPTPKATYKLWVFSAKWCKVCETQVPELNNLLKEDLSQPGSRLMGELIVPTGDKVTQPPTQEAAEKYRASYSLDLVARIDPPRWTYYEQYVQQKHELPAAVVFDDKGNALEVYTPNRFFPQEIAAYVKSLLAK